MSHNTFGHLFRVTTWGESHGPALGCVVDGVPPGIALTAEMIQGFLDKRRPGNGKFVTQRQEPDAVRILSGVFEDERTNGQRKLSATGPMMHKTFTHKRWQGIEPSQRPARLGLHFGRRCFGPPQATGHEMISTGNRADMAFG